MLADGVSPYVLGGMQRHSAMLAQHLAKLGAEVLLFHTCYDDTRRQEASTLADFPEPLRSRITSFFMPPPRPKKFPLHYLAESIELSQLMLRRYLRDAIAADFIYAQGLTGWAFVTASSATRRSLPPVGVNAHGYSMFQPSANLRSALQNVAMRPLFSRMSRRADYVFSFGGKIREIVQRRVGVRADRIIELPNAIESRWIKSTCPRSSDARHFLFVGRNDRLKGYSELIRAISLVPSGKWRFSFVGPIPEKEWLTRPDVHYLGPLIDTAQLKATYDTCDCLVVPSFAEGMPTVILEAMARGLAIIATDVGATSQLVDSTNGILLPHPNPKLIAAALHNVTSMSLSQLHNLKSSSLEKARRFTWDQVAEKSLFAIEAALGRCNT